MMELDTQDKTRLSRSITIAAVIWLVLLLFFAFVPVVRNVPEDREFPEVRLVLQSAVQPPARKITTTSEQRTAEPVAQQTTKPSQSAPAPSPSREQPVAGLGIPDFQSTSGTDRPSPASGEYLDFSSDRPREQQVRDPAPAIQEFEGSAARVDTSPSRQGTSSTEAGRRPSVAADETLQALDRIRDASSGDVAVPADTVSRSSTTDSRSSTTGSVSTRQATPGAVGPITFDGDPRRLVHPSKPVIVLPPHLARLIESDRTVTVHFTVRADGSVPGSLVSFTPSALLPPEIRNYLKNEFMNWRFERGNNDGQARFLYSIKVQ